LSLHNFTRNDVAARQAKLADVVSTAIVPRLVTLHKEVLAGPATRVPPPADWEIERLARLVLSPDINAAAAYVTLLRERGLSVEALFVGLLEPAARHLGAMWDRDECDFVDVTLGLGRLQKLLAVFNSTHTLQAVNSYRRVLLATTPDEQHSFGALMVEKFLRSSGWDVSVEFGGTEDRVLTAVRERWFAVAGFTVGSERQLGLLESAIGSVRAASRNSAIGVMVGGPVFTNQPDLAPRIGADATAADAVTAVLIAQMLFDVGARRDWLGTLPD
jgi:MerR family transcriptional regulator, light-induced transcriptional regulator